MLNRARGCSRQVGWCAGAACVALGLNGCSSGSDAEPPVRGISKECTVLEPGEPAAFAPEVQVLAGEDAPGRAAGSLTRSLLADGEDVYWYDYSGSVFVARQGNGPATELIHAEPPSEQDANEELVLGLAANTDQVFVGYGPRSSFSDTVEPNPPGRLLSLSKRDGQAEVLLELDSYWIAPILADSERVIVFAMDIGTSLDAGFYQVPLAAPRLEPLPLGSSGPSDPAYPLALG
ncbi:MAG: hypothetical protein RL033_7828, partial [Pseudomonadota bacterium]